MALSPIERAKVWNVLDPELRKKVTSGKISMDEAASYVIPIGDLEQERGRVEAASRPVTPGLDGEPAISDRSETSIAAERGIIQGGQAVDAVQLGYGLEGGNQAELARQIKTAERPGFPLSMFDPATAGNMYQDIASTLVAGVNSTENIDKAVSSSVDITNENIQQLKETRAKLAELPPNSATKGFADAVDAGDWVTAAKLAGPAAYFLTLENAPTTAAQIAVTGGTALITRTPTAIGASAKIAQLMGAGAEFGGDLENIIQTMPEADRDNPEKLLEASRLAMKATAARMAVETLAPVGGVGRTLTSKIATASAGGILSEPAGEAASAYVRGVEVSAGELALEALGAGPLTIAAESGTVLGLEAAKAKQELATKLRSEQDMGNLQRQADERVTQFIQMNADEDTARADNEQFDAEAEADRAIESFKLNNAKQTEMPLGSGFGGNLSSTNADGTPTLDADGNPAVATGRRIPENDRTPTIQNMFSGETTAATKVQDELTAKAQREEAGVAPPETDDGFEVRTQREAAARDSIDGRKQTDFEVEQQKKADRRRVAAEDQTVLNQEKQLQSTADITREATRRLEFEQEEIRRNPENRRGIKNARLGDTLAAYARKRKPALIEEVRTERATSINAARERTLAEEERQTALEDIDVQNELGQRQDDSRAKEKKAAEPQATDLFGDQPQTSLLPPAEQPARPKFTGTLTEKQAQVELAAGQLNRQKQQEKIAPAEKAAKAAAVDAELPSVEKAVQSAVDKKVSLTTKSYVQSEQKAQKAIIEDELTKNGNRPTPEIAKAVATRMADWRRANPRPDSVPAPTASNPVLEKAKQIAKSKETAEKAKETKNLSQKLKSEIDRGATPEEAANTVLNKEDEAKLRNELGNKESEDAEGNEVFLGEDHPKETIVKSNTTQKAANPTLYAQMKAELTNGSPDIVRMLELVVRDPLTPAFQQLLARRLIPTARAIGLKLQPSMAGMDAGGTYRPSTNTVYMNVLTPELVLHEVLHGILANVIRNPSAIVGSGMRARVLIGNLERLRLQTITDFDAGVVTRTGQVPRQLGTKLATGKGPLSSVDELISYFMTNSDLQYLLDQNPSVPGWAGKVQALATAFYKYVSGFLGLNTKEEASALQQLSTDVSELLSIVETNREAVAKLADNIVAGANLSGDEVTITARPFSNPVTIRAMKEFSIGKYSVKLRPDWTESFGSFVGTAIDALTGGAGKSRRTTEVFERAQSDTASMIQAAENLFKTIDFNLEGIATEKKIDIKGFREEFTADITKMEDMPEGLTKQTQAKKMVDKYGEAARSYFSMRRVMDNLSRDILKQRLDDARPFTEAEAKIYRSIKEKIGSYYSRIYAANTKGVGAERARKLMKEYEKVAKGSLNPEFQDGYKIVKDAIQFVSDNMLTVPSRDKLETKNLAQLKRLADAWGIEIVGEADLDSPMQAATRKEQYIDSLLKFAEKTPEARERRATQLVEDTLFSREKGVITDYYRGSKQDRTIVTEREAVPPAIRKLLGEYEDLPLRAMITIARQAEFRARTKAFRELITLEEGTRILSDEEYEARGASPKDWTKLKGPSYGALAGYWVREDLATKLEDSAEVVRTFDQVMTMADTTALSYAFDKGIKVWSSLAGTVKSVQLVWNAANLAFNFGGGGLITMSNGNFSPKAIVRAFKVAGDLITSQAARGGKLTDDMTKVVRAGITDSAFMGDIRAVELEQLRQSVMESLASPLERKATGLTNLKDRTKRTWKETYAMADVVWKIANFFAEEAKLGAFNKAEGTTMTAEQVEREAARRTNVSNFSYKRVPDMLKIVEKAGITYILPYIYESFRAPFGSILVGLEDIQMARTAKTPKGKALMVASGAKRMVGAMMVMGLAQQMLYTMAKALTDEDEDFLDKLKPFLPEYKQFSDFLYMGRDANGDPVLFEFSRLDPFGPATEFYAMAIRGAEPAEYLEAFKKLTIANPYGSSILNAFIQQGNTNARIQDIHPALYETLTYVGNVVPQAIGLEGRGKYFAKVVDTMLPSWYVRALDPKNSGVKDDPASELMGNMGMQMTKVNPGLTIQFAANVFSAESSSIKTELYDFLKSQYEPTDEDILRKLIELRGKEDKAYEAIEKLYVGGQALGYTPAQILGVMKEKKVDEKALMQIANGGYAPNRSSLVSQQGIEQSWAGVVKDDNMTRERKQRYLDNLNRVMRLAGEGRVPLGE